MNPNNDYLETLSGKPTSSWFYVNWEPLYVPQFRWQHCLAMSLHLDASLPHVMNQCSDEILTLYKIAIFFVDPFTRQTYPDAQFQNCSNRIRNLFQFVVDDENPWFTITPTLEHRKRPAVFGPKYVTPVSRRAFGGAGDARIYTQALLSEFWDIIVISTASKKL